MQCLSQLTAELTRLGAARTPHANGPLLDHLVGTHDLLREWDARLALCNAGLFHSIYGTQNYQNVLVPLTERRVIRHLIGRESETIVYRFAIMDRKHFYRRVGVSRMPIIRNHSTGAVKFLHRKAMADLLMLTMANALEFGFAALKARNEKTNSGVEDLCRRFRPYLPEATRRSIDQYVAIAG